MWAEANKGVHSELKGVNWLALSREQMEHYQLMLTQAKRQDEEIFPQNVISNTSSGCGGDEYARTHIFR